MLPLKRFYMTNNLTYIHFLFKLVAFGNDFAVTTIDCELCMTAFVHERNNAKFPITLNYILLFILYNFLSSHMTKLFYIEKFYNKPKNVELVVSKIISVKIKHTGSLTVKHSYRTV